MDPEIVIAEIGYAEALSHTRTSHASKSRLFHFRANVKYGYCISTKVGRQT